MKRTTLSILAIFFLTLLTSCSSHDIVIDDPDYDVSGFTLSRESFKDRKLTGKKSETDMETMKWYIDKTLQSYYTCDQIEMYSYQTETIDYDWAKEEHISEFKFAADIKANRSKICSATIIDPKTDEIWQYNVSWYINDKIYKKQYTNNAYKKSFYNLNLEGADCQILLNGGAVEELRNVFYAMRGYSEITNSSLYSVDENNYEFKIQYLNLENLYDYQCVVIDNEIKWIRLELDLSKGQGKDLLVYESAARKNADIKIEDPIDMDTYEMTINF